MPASGRGTHAGGVLPLAQAGARGGRPLLCHPCATARMAGIAGHRPGVTYLVLPLALLPPAPVDEPLDELPVVPDAPVPALLPPAPWPSLSWSM